MRTIKKFTFSSVTNPIVIMPKGSKILKIANKRSSPCIYAECRDDAPRVKRLFRIYETGSELPDEPGQYLNTIMFLGHEWHLFDGGERPLE